MNNAVIIVGGGSGKRFGGTIPKQFALLRGKPVLMHTIAAFFRYDANLKIVLVLPQIHIDYWHSLCRTHHFLIGHQVVEGGEERFHSVKNGLQVVQNQNIIAVHDAVRPVIEQSLLQRLYPMAQTNGNAVPVVIPTESLREIKNEKSVSIDRQNIRMVQTPQCFRASQLHNAYQQTYSPFFTDDSSVVEAMGETIHLVEGSEYNIKITRAADLQVASLYMEILSER